MEKGTLSAGNWMGRTVEVLARALDLRTQKHAVIAGNLANLDTPGYVPRELTFEGELQQALGQGGLQARRTNERHLPMGPNAVASLQPRLEFRNDYALGNGSHQLDLEREMSLLAQNHLQFEVTAQLIAKKLGMLRQAISEGGK